MFQSPLNKALTVAAAAIAFGAVSLPAAAATTEGQTVMYAKAHEGKQLYCAKEQLRVDTRAHTTSCKTAELWAKDGLYVPKDAFARQAADKNTNEG